MKFNVGDTVMVTSSSDSRDDRLGMLAIVNKALPCALWQLPEYYVLDFLVEGQLQGHFYGHELRAWQ